MDNGLYGMFTAKKVVLLGAGVSNMPLARMLSEMGAHLVVCDKKTEDEMGPRSWELRALGAELFLGEDYLDHLHGDYIFRSPGFRPDMPELLRARREGAVVTSEMELFIEKAPCRVIGVTGSDGKSTTTTLISKILEAENAPGRTVFLGGNIGEPLLNRISRMKKEDIACAELSSFQLMSICAPVSIAVIKNVTPNHLNWHTGMDEYIAAKARILNGCGKAVLNYDDEVCRDLCAKCACPVVWFSRRSIPGEFLADYAGGVYPENGSIVYYDSKSGTAEEVVSLSDILLPGEHNIENYSTAIAAVWGLASKEAVCSVAKNFGGVRHRMELVREKDGVKYYNSSIDSSPTRTAAAISIFTCPVRIICGGYDKKIPFEPLAEALVKHKSVKTVVLTGATREKIKEALEKTPGFATSGIEVKTEPLFGDAVRAAADAAQPGDVVLLSPACASFDAFPNFEVRGEAFREAVNLL